MLPLALILRAQGHEVKGSDRMLDQGRTAQKFDFLRARGIALFPQDGSGLTHPDQILVASTAIEETVPDVQAARQLGIPRMSRADLLSGLFNAAPTSIAVAGTSGKSTTTGMIGWILQRTGRRPTIVNGAVMKNFVTADSPFASAAVGNSDLFAAEVDESDGSIALYNPTIAVLNNIALDHKSLDELRTLFRDFVARAGTVVVNLDNAETAALAAELPPGKTITVSLSDPGARLRADTIIPAPNAIDFEVIDRTTGASAFVQLPTPGRHNAANALSALGAAIACGVPLEDAASALDAFMGLKRRLEYVGEVNDITVIDDFAHNPDKIEATLTTLHTFAGRLLILFQPHGFGPLRLMKDAFVDCFADNLDDGDVLIMPDPVYFGGTVDRSVSSGDIVDAVRARGHEAWNFPERAQCGEKLLELAQPYDRIIVMGARDDTLSQFAAELLDRLGR